MADAPNCGAEEKIGIPVGMTKSRKGPQEHSQESSRKKRGMGRRWLCQMKCNQGEERVAVVNSMLGWGATQDWSGGQPGSVVELRQRLASALETSEGPTAPLSGSA